MRLARSSTKGPTLVSGIVLNLLVYVLVGIVIFWRKSDDRMALLALLALMLFPIAFNNGTVMKQVGSLMLYELCHLHEGKTETPAPVL